MKGVSARRPTRARTPGAVRVGGFDRETAAGLGHVDLQELALLLEHARVAVGVDPPAEIREELADRSVAGCCDLARRGVAEEAVGGRREDTDMRRKARQDLAHEGANEAGDGGGDERRGERALGNGYELAVARVEILLLSWPEVFAAPTPCPVLP